VKTLNRDRRSCSSKTALGLQFESTFNLEIELKNVILGAFRLFAFSHSQGQNAKHSARADVFRFASKFRHCSMWSALRISANGGHAGADLEAIDGRTMKEPMNALPMLS
jgi:hypothetical protein